MEQNPNLACIVKEHLNKVQLFIEDFDGNLDDTYEDKHHIVSVLDDFTENLEEEFEEFYEILKCENNYLDVNKLHDSMLDRLRTIKHDYVLNEDIDVDEVMTECDTWFLYYKKYF